MTEPECHSDLWFGRWLRGRGRGRAGPYIKIWVMGPGTWSAAAILGTPACAWADQHSEHVVPARPGTACLSTTCTMYPLCLCAYNVSSKARRPARGKGTMNVPHLTIEQSLSKASNRKATTWLQLAPYSGTSIHYTLNQISENCLWLYPTQLNILQGVCTYKYCILFFMFCSRLSH